MSNEFKIVPVLRQLRKTQSKFHQLNHVMIHLIKGQVPIVVSSATEMSNKDLPQGKSRSLNLEVKCASLPFLQESFDDCASHLHPNNELPKMRGKNKTRYRLVNTIVLYASFLAFVSTDNLDYVSSS